MNPRPRQIEKQVIAKVVLLCLAIATLGWAFAFYLLGGKDASTAMKSVSTLGYEICITAFLAFTIGLAVQYYLTKVPADPQRDALIDAGIDSIFPNRLEAAEEFLKLIENPNTRRIDILGISLRDFIGATGGLQEVWNAISRRLESESDQGVP